jgi:hypothetical protein
MARGSRVLSIAASSSKRAWEPFRAEGSHRNGRTSTDDQPGFLDEEPEHCYEGCRPIRAGEGYLLTVALVITSSDRSGAAGVFRLRGIRGRVSSFEGSLTRQEVRDASRNRHEAKNP